MNAHLPRLLVAGVGPLPPEGAERLFAPGLRVWGMARELARVGHPVRLVTVRFGEKDARAFRFDLSGGALPEPLPRTLPEGGLAVLLAAEAKEFGVDAAVSSTDVMNHALAGAGLDLPIWMDFFGDPMAERQLLALHGGTDAGVDEQWAMVAPALARGDRFSGCSTDQCSALLGQLAAVGRLGRYTATERLVHRLPPWIEPIAGGGGGAGPVVKKSGAEMFLIVQTGGFNTWLDVEMLFAVMEKAMAGDARVHFAATGGAIPGHFSKGFETFKALIETSANKGRYHLVGWLKAEELAGLLNKEADLAVNFDVPCAEGILGTRNRLLDWLLAGVPVISTPGCELAIELAEEGALMLTPHGDANAAARLVLACAADPESKRAIARRAGEMLRRERTAEGALRPLLEWALSPIPASDLQSWRGGAEPPGLWRGASVAAENLERRRREAEKVRKLEENWRKWRGLGG